MSIVQTFYDNLANHYDKLFNDFDATTTEQALILNNIFEKIGFNNNAKILDCACGIGTQSIGLAALGYNITASDISEAEISEAIKRADNKNLEIDFRIADFRRLEETFNEKFDIVIAMDNALPHMLTKEDLECAIKSIAFRINDNGIFVGSIRDYDALLLSKPPYSAPYIHKTELGQRVSFQTWEWNGEIYKLIQYIIEDAEKLSINKFECEYRATTRKELTDLFLLCGCSEVSWLFPEETGFYQPIVVARK